MSEGGKSLKEVPKCQKEATVIASIGTQTHNLAMQMLWWAVLVLIPFLCPLACLSPKDNLKHVNFKCSLTKGILAQGTKQLNWSCKKEALKD